MGSNLYASNNGKNFTKLNKKGLRTTLGGVLKPLKNGRKYYFAVTAVGADGTESKRVVSKRVVPSRHARKF